MHANARAHVYTCIHTHTQTHMSAPDTRTIHLGLKINLFMYSFNRYLLNDQYVSPGLLGMKNLKNKYE